MSHKTEHLVSRFASLIESVSGSHCTFERLAGFETSGADTLVFLTDYKQFELLKLPQPAVLITDSETSGERSGPRYMRCGCKAGACPD